VFQLNEIRRALVLGAHPDDGEFGCGATMAKLVESGVEVHYAMFSLCQESVPDGFPKDVLRGEALNSSRILGLDSSRLIYFEFPVRKFPQFRQEILEEMVRMRKELQPDLVLLPSNHDLHQDHATIAREGWRAFKAVSILGYEVPWNNLTFTAHLFSLVETDHLDRKIRALREYRSQEFRSYAKDEFIRSLAGVRGTQIGKELAEAFEVIRWII
jgi:LmbE family N-acetylglucosaminyl deacetylase